MPRPTHKGSTYLPALDGLRALAVGFVVLYHLHVPGFSGGLLGVGVFFTLSGYLITSLLLSTRARTGGFALKRFWLARARRLLPAVLLVMGTALIATAITMPDKLAKFSWQALSAMFYVNNWYNITSSESYFDRFGAPGPFDHLWSLSIEEQFYLLWPLLLAGLLGVFKKRVWVTLVILAVAVVSFMLLSGVAHAGFDNTRAYEGTDTRAGGLLLGAALAFWWPARARTVSHNTRCTIDVVALAGLGLIVYLIATTPDGALSLYQGVIALLTVATLAVLIATVVPDTLVASVLGIGPLRWIGERSYGIYLWHMPVIAFIPATFSSQRPVATAFVVIPTTLVLSALSWRYVEDPIRRRGFRNAFTTPRDPEDTLMNHFLAWLIAVTTRFTGWLTRLQQQLAADPAVSAPPADESPARDIDGAGEARDDTDVAIDVDAAIDHLHAHEPSTDATVEGSADSGADHSATAVADLTSPDPAEPDAADSDSAGSDSADSDSADSDSADSDSAGSDSAGSDGTESDTDEADAPEKSSAPPDSTVPDTADETGPDTEGETPQTPSEPAMRSRGFVGASEAETAPMSVITTAAPHPNRSLSASLSTTGPNGTGPGGTSGPDASSGTPDKRAPRTRRRQANLITSILVVLALAVGGLIGLNSLHADQPSTLETASLSENSPTTRAVAAGPTLPVAARRTSCDTVIHIGDSTSIGMNDPDTLPNPVDRIAGRYRQVGAKTVITDIVGARSSLETVDGEPNAVTAIEGHLARRERGCWVMAMGINDTANVQVGGAGPVDMRIDRLLSPLKGQEVMWPTVITSPINQNPAYNNNAMQQFNKALLRACQRYPNLRLYNWAGEAQPGWFSDGIHYTAAGYTQRAYRFSIALASIFPATDAAPNGCVLQSSGVTTIPPSPAPPASRVDGTPTSTATRQG